MLLAPVNRLWLIRLVQPPELLRVETPELLRRYPFAFGDRRFVGFFDEAGAVA